MSEKFITPEPLPSDFENELLTIFREECDEASIRASKMKRFGVKEVQPEQPYDNSQRLAHEIGDLEEMIEFLKREGLINEEDIEEGRQHKRDQLKKFMQTKRSQ